MYSPRISPIVKLEAICLSLFLLFFFSVILNTLRSEVVDVLLIFSIIINVHFFNQIFQIC